MNSPSTTLTERVLVRISKFFNAAGIIRVPIAMTAVGAALLALPPQTREVYRVVALDIWYRYYFPCGGNVLTSECPRFELVREPLLAGLALLGAALAIWYAACRLAWAFWPTAPEAQLERTVLRWAPAVLALTLVMAAAWGIYWSVPFQPNSENAAILNAMAEHKAVALAGAQATPDDVEAAGKLIAFLALPATSLTIMALLVVALAACLFAVLFRKFDPKRMTPAKNWEIRSPSIAFFGLLIIFLAAPVAISRWLGSIAVLGLFLICATLMLSQLGALSSRYKIPFIFLLACWAAFWSWSGANNNHEVELGAAAPDRAEAGDRRVLKEVLAEWYESRPKADKAKYEKDGKPYPLYIVAAQGGGIYAAYHAARLLGVLQDRCPAFGWHTFAISGVSGGSVGASVFVSLLKDKQIAHTSGPAPCEPGTVTNSAVFTRGGSLAEEAGAILDQDLLSPLVAGLFFRDVLQTVLPFPIPPLDRSRALDRSLERAFDKPTNLSGAAPMPRADTSEAPLRQAYITHWNARASWPALLLNTTDVRTGQRRIMAPFQFGDSEQLLPVWPGEALGKIKLSTAAFLSARFPWVTPSAWFRDTSGNVSYLVDGGYYDNSGVATAQELMEAIENSGMSAKVQPRLIILTGAPGAVGGPEPILGFNEPLDPIRAFLSSWGIRPIEAIRWADKNLNKPPDSKRAHVIRLSAPLYNLPLGWRLSGGTAYLINAEDPVPGRCRNSPCDGSTKMRFDADCLLRDLERELL